MKKLIEKTLMLLNTGLLVMTTFPVLADTQNPFNKLSSTASHLTQQIQMVTVVVATAMLAICGGLYLIPSKKMRETIKSHIGSVLIGIGIVFAAGMVASYVVTWFR